MNLRAWKTRLAAWLDAWWYGQPWPLERALVVVPPQPVWLGGLTPRTLLLTHQHQFDGRQTTPNDCAVAGMAMLIHQALLLAGYHDVQVPYHRLARALDRAPLYGLGFYRVPFVGALPPGRAAAALRCLARAFVAHGHPRPWRVHVRGRLHFDRLLRHLILGYPTMLYGVGDTGVPHAMVVVGYDPATDRWALLDPAFPQPYRGKPALRTCSSARLLAWWQRRYFAYQRRTAVWLSDIPRLRLLTAAEPSPKTVPLAPVIG